MQINEELRRLKEDADKSRVEYSNYINNGTIDGDITKRLLLKTAHKAEVAYNAALDKFIDGGE